MYAGRILLDTYVPQAQQWCWRRDWHIRWESAWTLLWKFTYLNQLTARDLASLLISRKCGKRSAILAKSQVDLRDGTVFDLDVLASVLRVEQSAVRDAFLYNIAPGSMLRSSDFLRWCESCMAKGFHTPVFQISTTRVCPLHRRTLIDRCPHCDRKIPYLLTTAYCKQPFACPYCAVNMTPTMLDDRPKLLQLRAAEAGLFGEALRFHRVAKVELINVVDAQRLHEQVADFGITAVRYEEMAMESGYLGFLAQVLQDEEPDVKIVQSGLRFERIARHECGWSRPHDADDDDETLDDEHTTTAGETGRRLSPAAGGLDKLFVTYKAVRRRLWRRVLKNHQRCIRSAAAQLWWNVHGDCTVKFCPYAMAFLRWRMFWEGCGTPRYLYAPPAKEMYGIIAWYLARPCPSPRPWSSTTKEWIASHLFATTAMDSFELLMRWAKQGAPKAKVCWNQPISPVHYSSLWAVAGRDCHDRPAVVYVKRPDAERLPPAPYPTSSEHWRSHQMQVCQLAR